MSARTQQRQRAETLICDDLRELQKARALWARDQIGSSLALFEDILRRYPNHARALADASRAFGAVHMHDRAEILLSRLTELGRGRANILHLAAQSYRLIRRPQRAEEVFQQALTCPHPDPDTYLELALLAERRNDLDRAWDYLMTRLRLAKDDQAAVVVKGRILRRQGQYSEAIPILQGVTRRETHWLNRLRAWSELAQLYDQLGQFHDAWNAMLAGKKLAASHASAAQKHRDQTVPELYRLCDSISADHIERWSRQAPVSAGPIDICLLTGMPRSGTTLLASMLHSHPQLVAADEFDVFPRFVVSSLVNGLPFSQLDASLLDHLPHDVLERSRRMYGELLRGAIDPSPQHATCIVDKGPSLLPLIPFFVLVRPSRPLIVMLRDPRDTLVSSLMSFIPPLNDVGVDLLSPKTAASRLIQDMMCWHSLKGKLGNIWCEVRYEELIHNPRPVLEKVIQRLGVDWSDNLLQHDMLGRTGHVHSPSYDQVTQPVYTRALGRWRNYSVQLAPYLEMMDPVLRAFEYGDT